MKTVIIGCGRMGQRHITAARKLNLKIVGVFDKSKKAKLETKEKFNMKDNFFFSNIEIMMKQTKPSLAIIATTADTHLKFTLLSIKFGAKFIGQTLAAKFKHMYQRNRNYKTKSN